MTRSQSRARIPSAAYAALAFFLMAACSDGVTTPPATPALPPVAHVQIAPENVTIVAADSLQLAVTLRAADGSTLTGRPLSWRSSDEAVVGVSPGGKITARSEGAATVSVLSGGAQGEVRITVLAPRPVPEPSPVPVLSAIAPATVVAETPNFTLTLTGTGFTRTMWVRIEEAILVPTYVSETELRVEVGSNHVLRPGELSIRVLNLPPGGGYSGALTLNVQPHPEARPAPVLASLAPAQLVAGSGAQEVTLTGSAFVPASVVRVGGLERPTTYVNESTLRVRLPAEDVANPRNLWVGVWTPGPAGGTSAGMTLPVRPAAGS